MKKIYVVIFTILATSQVMASELRGMLIQAMEYYNSGNCDEALPIFDTILEANLPQVMDNETLSYSLNYYAGYCAKTTGDINKAALYLSKATRSAKKLIVKDQLPVLYTFLGEVMKEKGDYQKATLYLNNALLVLPDNSTDAAMVNYLLAETYRANSEFDKAIDSCKKSMEIAATNKAVKVELACLTSIGEVYNETGEYPLAIKKFTRALTLAQRSQLPVEMANNHMGLGLVYQNVGKLDLARQNYNEALRLYIATSTMVNIPLIVNHLLELPTTAAESRKALEQYKSYSETLLGDADTDTQLSIELLTANFYARSGNYMQALSAYQEILELAISGEYYLEATKTVIILSNLLYDMNDFTGAVDVLNQTLDSLIKAGNDKYTADLYRQLSKINAQLGRKSLAIAYLKKAIAASKSEDETVAFQNEIDLLMKGEN